MGVVAAAQSTQGAEVVSVLHAGVAVVVVASCLELVFHGPSEVRLAREATVQNTDVLPKHNRRLAVQAARDAWCKAALDPWLRRAGLHRASLTQDTCLLLE